MRELFFFCFEVKKNECRLWFRIITPMSPPQVVRALIQLFMQAALYGLYVATLIHCLRWLVYTNDGWKLRDRVSNKLILITTILIFLFSTGNLVLMLPIPLFFIGDFGDRGSNILSMVPVAAIAVCKYHGWCLDPKND